MKPDYGFKNWEVVLFAILLPVVLMIALFDMWAEILWMKIKVHK